METQNRLMKKSLATAILAASLLMTVGCAKKSDSGDPAPAPAAPGAVTPNTPDPSDTARGSDFAAGATAPLTLESLAALSSYAITHPINNPKDLRISVKLRDVGSNQFAGDVMISYYDNGQYYTGRFQTRDAQNPSGSTATSGTLYPGWKHAAYNNWFANAKTGGKPVFHGFFQDQYGAILLIVDQVLDLGDGTGASEVSGQIWFKNFANSQMQPNYQSIPCWFITAGPYDCRTFLTGSGDGNVDTTSAVYPTGSLYYTSRSINPYIYEEPARGWRRLGTFGSLNKAKAFSQ